MTTVLSQKGQIVLPSAVREQMHLEPGQDFEVIVDLLQACPYPFELPPRANDRPRSIEL